MGQPEGLPVICEGVLNLLPLHELADLSSNAFEHDEELFVGLADLMAEELHCTQKLFIEDNRKREARVQAFRHRYRSARKIVVLSNIGNPRGLQGLLNSAGQTD